MICRKDSLIWEDFMNSDSLSQVFPIWGKKKRTAYFTVLWEGSFFFKHVSPAPWKIPWVSMWIGGGGTCLGEGYVNHKTARWSSAGLRGHLCLHKSGRAPLPSHCLCSIDLPWGRRGGWRFEKRTFWHFLASWMNISLESRGCWRGCISSVSKESSRLVRHQDKGIMLITGTSTPCQEMVLCFPLLSSVSHGSCRCG